MMATTTLQQRSPTQRSAARFQNGTDPEDANSFSSVFDIQHDRRAAGVAVTRGSDSTSTIRSHRPERGQPPSTPPRHGHALRKDLEWNSATTSQPNPPPRSRGRSFGRVDRLESRLDKWGLGGVTRMMQVSSNSRVKFRIMWKEVGHRYLGFRRVVIGLILFGVMIHLGSRHGDGPGSGVVLGSDDQYAVSTTDASRRINAPVDEVRGISKRRSRSKHHTKAPVREVTTPGMIPFVSDAQEHPITELIVTAKHEWNDKNRRQSRTLREAVAEYKKRYQTSPPRGFNRWWHYIKKHSVPLPDEYNSIWTGLEPYRAYSKAHILADRIRQASLMEPNSYTISLRNGTINHHDRFVDTGSGETKRRQYQIDLIEPVKDWLGDMDMVWTVADTASHVIPWLHRQELLECAESGECGDLDMVDLSRSGWSAACPMASPYSQFQDPSRQDLAHTTRRDESVKRFIASHSRTFDPCDFPLYDSTHGYISSRAADPGKLVPVFTLSKSSLNSDILGVPLEDWMNQSFPQVDWDKKTSSKLVWRGSTTGGYWRGENGIDLFRKSQRARLVNLTHDTPETSGHHVPVLSHNLTIASVSTASLGSMLDLAFSGIPVSCEPSDGTCETIGSSYRFGNTLGHLDQAKYKYIMDVDGNAWSSRFMRIMQSNSVIFKSTIMPEWWTERAQPWVHFVPVQVDYSDLFDILVYFEGLPSQESSTAGHQEEAAQIAAGGRNWVRTHWRAQDMVAYTARLYLEWGRLQASRPETMDYVYDESDEWSG